MKVGVVFHLAVDVWKPDVADPNKVVLKFDVVNPSMLAFAASLSLNKPVLAVILDTVPALPETDV
jgi:hypothetical protein